MVNLQFKTLCCVLSATVRRELLTSAASTATGTAAAAVAAITTITTVVYSANVVDEMVHIQLKYVCLATEQCSNAWCCAS